MRETMDELGHVSVSVAVNSYQRIVPQHRRDTGTSGHQRTEPSEPPPPATRFPPGSHARRPGTSMKPRNRPTESTTAPARIPWTSASNVIRLRINALQ